jgi:stage V sporulation protein B
MAILQGNRQFRALNISRMLTPPLTAALMVTYLAAGERSLVLATCTWTVLIWVTALITGIFALRGLEAEPARLPSASAMRVPSLRALMGFGLKSLLGSVTPLEGFQLDQAIVGIFISQAALGLYVVGVAFTNLPRFISQAIGLVAYPNVAADRDGRGMWRSIIRFAVMTLLLCGIAVLVIEVLLPFLVTRLFGSAFHESIAVARILLLSALLFALRRVLTECARGAGRPGLGSIAELVSLLTLFPTVAILSSSGARGVAVALVIAAAAGLAGMVVGLLVRQPQVVRAGAEFEGVVHQPAPAAAPADLVDSGAR